MRPTGGSPHTYDGSCISEAPRTDQSNQLFRAFGLARYENERLNPDSDARVDGESILPIREKQIKKYELYMRSSVVQSI
jgi:hypothetical protein